MPMQNTELQTEVLRLQSEAQRAKDSQNVTERSFREVDVSLFTGPSTYFTEFRFLTSADCTNCNGAE